jgi:hypothetical protein
VRRSGVRELCEVLCGRAEDARAHERRRGRGNRRLVLRRQCEHRKQREYDKTDEAREKCLTREHRCHSLICSFVVQVLFLRRGYCIGVRLRNLFFRYSSEVHVTLRTLKSRVCVLLIHLLIKDLLRHARLYVTPGSPATARKDWHLQGPLIERAYPRNVDVTCGAAQCFVFRLFVSECGGVASQPLFDDLLISHSHRCSGFDIGVDMITRNEHSGLALRQKLVATGTIVRQRLFAALLPVTVEARGMAARGRFEGALLQPERIVGEICRTLHDELVIRVALRLKRLMTDGAAIDTFLGLLLNEGGANEVYARASIGFGWKKARHYILVLIVRKVWCELRTGLRLLRLEKRFFRILE